MGKKKLLVASMCISFIYVNNNPEDCDYQVVIANNRDEFYSRPSKPAGRWPDKPQCISGLDLEVNKSGGTWLGLSETGKIGFLLNVATPDTPNPNKRGRGYLVPDFLKNEVSANDYLSTIAKEKHLYNPFHLVLLEKRQQKWNVHYLGSENPEEPCILSEGFHGWCNGSFSQPWQKMEHGLARFSDIVARHKTKDDRNHMMAELKALLSDGAPHLPDVYLEAVHSKKGKAAIEGLSGIFVDVGAAQYGTRTSTLVLIDQEGCGELIEKTMKEPIVPNEPIWLEQTIPFQMQN